MKSYVSDDYQGASISGVNLEQPVITGGSITGSTQSGGSLAQEIADRISADSNLAAVRAAADQVLQDDINTRVSKAGDLMTGTLRVPTLVVSETIVEKAWTFAFAATGNNQKLDLYCSSTSGLESLLDIVISTNTGTLSRRFSLQKQGTGIIQSGTRYNEVIGNVAPYLAISDVEWDTVNLRWRFKIVNRAPLGIPLTGSISIRLIANTNNGYALSQTFGVSSVYTNDTSTYSEPIFQFAGAIQADALITNFIKKGVNYTLNNVDSILICTAGITVTLPAMNLIGTGRSFTIKNIQNSGVTVVPTSPAKIDTVTSYTVGNKRTITVTSDGVDWWITSAF